MPQDDATTSSPPARPLLVAVGGALAWLAVLLAAAPLVAQTDDIDRQAARHHFARGAEQFKAGQYEDAIDAFEKAFAANPDPMILYNLSLAHLKAGHPQSALVNALRARRMDGLTRSASLRNDARIVALRRVMKARSQPSSPSGYAGPDRSSTDDNPLFGPSSDDSAGPADRMTDGTTDSPSEPASPPAFGTAGWIGVGIGAAGVASLLGAGLVGAGLDEDINAYQSAAESGDAQTYRRLRESIADRQTTGRVLLYSGIGLGVTGAGLVIYQLLATPEAPAASAGRPSAPIRVGLSPRRLQLRLSF